MDVYNSIYYEEDGNLYMIDPGRYHPQSSFTSQDYINNNKKLLLDKYLINMIKEEIKHFKLVPDDKVHRLVRLLEEEKKIENIVNILKILVKMKKIYMSF